MSRTHSARVISTLFLGLFAAGGAIGQSVWYVDGDATPPGDGLAWETAFTDLHDALDAVTDGDEIWIAAGTYKPDRGTGDRAMYYEFPPDRDVAIFGGFAGFETHPDQRDWIANTTTLSGDLNGDDCPEFANTDDNSYHIFVSVVDSYQGDYAYVLDGITLRDGNARGSVYGQQVGGAICVPYMTPPPISIRNCTFLDNQALVSGGAIDIFARFGGNLELSNCHFEHNRAMNEIGGAVAIWVYVDANIAHCRFVNNHAVRGGAIGSLSANLQLLNCEFHNNSADVGGAVSGGLTIEARACTFSHNRATADGGALAALNSYRLSLLDCDLIANRADELGGAIYSNTESAAFLNTRFLGNEALLDGGAAYSPGLQMHWSEVTTTSANCEFAGNSAGGDGGAVLLENRARASKAGTEGAFHTFTNCTIADNTASGLAGGIMYTQDVHCTLANTILYQNADLSGQTETAQINPAGSNLPVINYCDIQGWTGNLGGEGNFDQDPQFYRPLGVDGIPGTLDDDRRIVSRDSPCVDIGDNDRLPTDEFDLDADGNVDEPLPLDLADYPRMRGLDTGMPPTVDIGAYEARIIGDLNCDRLANNFDIEPFVLALTDPAAYAATYPDCDYFNADLNGDHLVDNFDIDAFIYRLTARH